GRALPSRGASRPVERRAAPEVECSASPAGRKRAAPNPLRAMEQGWRKATIAVTVFAALEFVLLAGAGVALLGNPLAGHFKAGTAKAASRPIHPTSQPKPTHKILPRPEVSVIVLNGNGRAG